jgi:hypothetical protein
LSMDFVLSNRSHATVGAENQGPARFRAEAAPLA